MIRAYRIVKRYFDCQLVLAGGGAADDPEGAIVLKEVLREADNDPDIKILELPAWAPLEVNALQRASTIVIQKSLREGFGLTVSEALWKKKPVVASAVGGIPIQIIHKHTGLLAHSVEGTAYQIRFLLSHPEIAAKLGEHGHQHVKENFLITQKLKRYLTLFLTLGPRSARMAECPRATPRRGSSNFEKQKLLPEASRCFLQFQIPCKETANEAHCTFLLLAGWLAPLASAQDDRFQAGAYADYFRISQTDTNMAGLGARVGVQSAALRHAGR